MLSFPYSRYCSAETNNATRLLLTRSIPSDYFPPNVNNVGSKDSEWNWIMLMAAAACFCTIFIITVFVYYVYFRLYSNRLQLRNRISYDRRFSWRSEPDFLTSPTEHGLCREAMEALPVFEYKPHESFIEGLRCSVCLCDFQESEKAKLLPNCNHSFDVDCIDMWFSSHSTCPLCRATVCAQPEEPLDSDGRQVEITIREDGQVDSKASPDEKSSRSSASGSAGSDPCNGALEQKDNDEETNRADVAIDIAMVEK